MTPKEYLYQLIKIDDEINSLVEEKEKLGAQVLGAVRYDSELSSLTNKVSRPTEEYFLKVEQYSQDINQKIDELVQLKIKVSAEIDRVEDRNCRNVLRHRYLLNKSWEKIASELCYEVSWIYRMHGEALEEFEKVNPDVFKQ